MKIKFNESNIFETSENNGEYILKSVEKPLVYSGIKIIKNQKKEKRYYEVTLRKIENLLQFGVCNEKQTLKSVVRYGDFNNFLGLDNIGEYIINGSYNNLVRKINPNDTVGVCLDFENEHIGFVVDNVFTKLSDEKILSKNENWYPCFFCSQSEEEFVVNFGEKPFKYSIPDGYQPYCSKEFFLVKKNSGLYTLKEGFYDICTRMYKPLPVSDATKENIEKYGFGNIEELTKKVKPKSIKKLTLTNENNINAFKIENTKNDIYIKAISLENKNSNITNKKDLTDGLSKENFTACSNHSGRYDYIPYLAFDNHEGFGGYDGFQMKNVKEDSNNWFKIDFKNKVYPSIFTIQSNEDYALPDKIKIFMSDDDVEYEFIDEISGIYYKDTKVREYKYKAPLKGYRYLKMIFKDIRNKDNWVTINQMQFFQENRYMLLQKEDDKGIYTLDEKQQLIKLKNNEITKDIFKQHGFNDFELVNLYMKEYNTLVFFEEDNTSGLNLELLAKEESFKPIDKLNLVKDEFSIMGCVDDDASICVKGTKIPFLQDKKILMFVDKDMTNINPQIKGRRLTSYKSQIVLNGKKILEEKEWKNNNKEYDIELKQEELKQGNNIFDVTVIQDDGIEIKERSIINNNTQRNYSLKLDGNSYVMCPVPQEFKLDDKKVQVIVKPDGGDWGVREDSGTFVTIKNCNVTIGYKQKCIIDEVRIWDKDKAQEYKDKPLKGDEDGLVALYRFNEYKGNIIFDSSKNCYHGNVVGNAIFVDDRKLEQNVVDAVIINDIGDAIKILPKNSEYNYKTNIIRPETPSTIIFKGNKKEEKIENGKIITFNVNKKTWEKINGVNILGKKNQLQITGNKKSKYRTEMKIDELGLTIDNFITVGYNIEDKVANVKTNNFKQAVTSYNNSTVVYQEDGSKVVKNNKFLLYNIEPNLILGMVESMKLFLQMGDEDGDKIQFRIEINGKQVYPTEGYSPLEITPVNFTKQLDSKDVKVGENNILKVYVKDEYEVETTHIVNFIGEYCGLMFLDEDEKYYSSDLGDIIKRLDFGVITAGRKSEIKKVYLKNTTGFEIKDLTISIKKETIPKNNAIKLSTQSNPFDEVDKIHFSKNLKNGEKVPFYIQIATKVMNSEDGVFTVTASAEPV